MLWTLGIATAVWWGWGQLGRRLRAHLVSTVTALNELDEAGAPRAGPKIKGTVVICGGSIGGLVAARVCTDHFEDVVIVEPEAWIATTEGTAPTHSANGEPLQTERPKRARVFQYQAVHVFLPLISRALDKLFPGFEAKSQSNGIPYLESSASVVFGGVQVPAPAEYYTLTGLPRHPLATRDTFERQLRQATREKCPNIRWITGTVNGVTPSPDQKTRLDDVVVRREDGTTEHVKATLVVDCTGAVAAGSKWLEAAGYGQSTSGKALALKDSKISYDPKVRYQCFEWTVRPESRERIFSAHRKAGQTEGSWYLYAYAPDASMEHRLFGLNVVEGYKIQGLFGGWGVEAEDCPRTLAQIKAYMRSLHARKPVDGWVYDVLDTLIADEGLGEHDEIPNDIYRIPPPTFIQYHRVSDLPSNFVAIGDAVCIVNPIFGQGCSKAALGALVLNSLLLRTTDPAAIGSDAEKQALLPLDFGKRFFQNQSTKLEDLWTSTKTPDYGWRTTVPLPGETLSVGAPIRAYFGMAIKASWRDREINHILYLATKMIGPGTDLMSPRIVAKVLWDALTASNTPPA